MKSRGHTFWSIACAVACSAGPINMGCAQPNPVVTALPLPPLAPLRSPVESFRTLLVLPAAERRAQLATRPADVRQKILDKLREYQDLTPDERELRLKATELRWYLKPLMTAPATNRPAQLALIPESLREMVAIRIEQWDKFPAAIQQLMLTNQVGPGYLASGSAVEFPPSPRNAIHKQLQDRFNRLFELTPGEKEKVLATLSDAERQQMEKTLAAFAQLTPIQRKQCLVSFAKFANLSPGERQEFLKNVDRWAQMSAAERQSWRDLVSIAPKVPPLPVLTRKPPPMPPPAGNPRVTPGAFSTNGG
jgi:hypothetical protein